MFLQHICVNFGFPKDSPYFDKVFQPPPSNDWLWLLWWIWAWKRHLLNLGFCFLKSTPWNPWTPFQTGAHISRSWIENRWGTSCQSCAPSPSWSLPSSRKPEIRNFGPNRPRSVACEWCELPAVESSIWRSHSKCDIVITYLWKEVHTQCPLLTHGSSPSTKLIRVVRNM